jgi:hypothetical protein
MYKNKRRCGFLNNIQVQAGQALENLKEKIPVGEHINNVFRAALSAVPTVGGVFSSLMTDYIPNRRATRIIEFAEAVASDIVKISDRLNADYVKTDEFAYLFEQCFKGVSEDYQQEKIDAYRAILLNSMLHPEMPQERNQLYLKIVNDLLPIHIHLLRAFYDPNGYARAVGIQTQSYSMTTSLSQLLRDLFPGLTADEIRSAVHDLDTLGLTNNISNSLTTMMSGGGIEKLAGRMTSYGRAFMCFITAA